MWLWITLFFFFIQGYQAQNSNIPQNDQVQTSNPFTGYFSIPNKNKPQTLTVRYTNSPKQPKIIIKTKNNKETYNFNPDGSVANVETQNTYNIAETNQITSDNNGNFVIMGNDVSEPPIFNEPPGGLYNNNNDNNFNENNNNVTPITQQPLTQQQISEIQQQNNESNNNGQVINQGGLLPNQGTPMARTGSIALLKKLKNLKNKFLHDEEENEEESSSLEPDEYKKYDNNGQGTANNLNNKNNENQNNNNNNDWINNNNLQNYDDNNNNNNNGDSIFPNVYNKPQGESTSAYGSAAVENGLAVSGSYSGNLFGKSVSKSFGYATGENASAPSGSQFSYQ